MESAIALIQKEREDQIEKHGYTPDNDDKHTENELIGAACAILTDDGDYWPHTWDIKTLDHIDTNKTEIERLVIAGALIVAEIERIQRSSEK